MLDDGAIVAIGHDQAPAPLEAQEQNRRTIGGAVTLYDSGYTDLVCVVPPGAQLAPNTSLKDLGKVPGMRGDNGWHGYNWRKHTPTLRQIEKWAEWASNIGLRGDKFPAVDIDVDDERLARIVQQVAHRVLGPAPVRRSTGSRRLLPYRTSSPFPRVALVMTWQGKSHKVEILAAGRQYLIEGKHPSGSDYRWETPLPDTIQLMSVDRDKVELFLSELEVQLRRVPGMKLERVGGGVEPKAAPPVQDELLAPSPEALEELVALIPNREEDRDGYVKFGHAVRAAGGEEAAYIFAEWASRWEDGHNDPDDVDRDYAGFGGPYRIGWDWLVKYAAENCRIDPQDEFEADLEAVPRPVPIGLGSALAAARTLGANVEELPAYLHEFAAATLPLGALERCVAIACAERTLRAAGFQQPQGLLNEALDLASGSTARTLTLAELMASPRQPVEWIAHGILPTGGSSIIGGAPKVGKTTLVRDLAAAAADGREWLGATVDACSVLYLSLEDPESHVRSEFERLGVGDPAAILLCITPPADALAYIRDLVVKHNIKLVIADTVQKLLRVRDLNDYAQVVGALMPYTNLARELGFHFVGLHHSKKGASDDVLDMLLGSTALAGAVDTVIGLKRDETGQRFIATRQRVGEDLHWTLLDLDSDTHRARLAGRRSEAELDGMMNQMHRLLTNSARLREEEIVDSVSGTTAKKRAALRRGVAMGRFSRDRSGKRGDPYLYSAAEDPLVTEAAFMTLDALTGQLPSVPDSISPVPIL
jgi:hypothetical protein